MLTTVFFIQTQFLKILFFLFLFNENAFLFDQKLQQQKCFNNFVSKIFL